MLVDGNIGRNLITYKDEVDNLAKNIYGKMPGKDGKTVFVNFRERQCISP